MDYQEKEARLDIYDIKKAIQYRKAIGETEWDRITVMALKELLEYKKIGFLPQDIKDLQKMYAERCEQFDRLKRDYELLECRKKWFKR